MPGTLYVSDLDGTLLTPEKRLSGYTMDTLNRMIEGGLSFTYATARSFASAHLATEGLHLRLPVITYNGAFIVDPEKNAPILRRMLDRAAVLPILDHIKKRKLPTLCYAYVGGEERVSYRPADANRQIREYVNERKNDKRMRSVETYDELFEGELFYFTVLTEYEPSLRLADCARAVPSCTHLLQRDIYGERDWWLEIYHRDAKKSIAARTLCEMLGYDRLVSFGDQLNDMSLFDVSDECYAVGNAAEELREKATGVIGSNERDGVARWLSERV